VSVLEKMAEVLESDLSSDAVRLWLWLFVRGKQTRIDVILDSDFPDVVPSLNALVSDYLVVEGAHIAAQFPERVKAEEQAANEDGELHPKLAKLKAKERILRAVESPKLKGAQQVISDAVERLFRAYNRARLKHGLRTLPRATLRAQKLVWRKVLVFLHTNNIDFDEYLDFAYEATRWQKVTYPSVNMLGGPYLQTKWFDREAPTAGHTYRAADANLRERLVDAGFAEAADLEDDQLRYLEEQATIQREMPHLREHLEDDSLEAMINHLAEDD